MPAAHGTHVCVCGVAGTGRTCVLMCVLCVYCMYVRVYMYVHVREVL